MTAPFKQNPRSRVVDLVGGMHDVNAAGFQTFFDGREKSQSHAAIAVRRMDPEYITSSPHMLAIMRIIAYEI